MTEIIASVLGGLIGGLFTFLGVWLTIHHENKKARQEELKQQKEKEEQLLENRPRLEIMGYKELIKYSPRKETDVAILLCSLFFQKAHSPQHCHRVSAAGHSADHRISGLHQSIFPDEGKQLILHASTPGPQRSGTGRPTAVSPCQPRHDGSWQRCTLQHPFPRCSRCSIHHGTGK